MEVGNLYMVSDRNKLKADALGHDILQYLYYRPIFMVEKVDDVNGVTLIKSIGSEDSSKVWIMNIETEEYEKFRIPVHLYDCFKEVILQANQSIPVQSTTIQHNFSLGL